LLPFILKYHKIEDILLWSDLATPHYQKDVLNWLRSQNISFVERPNNEPNCPQEPIEKYLALRKKEYKKRSKEPKCLNGFRIIWRNISKKVIEKSRKNLTERLRVKLRSVGYAGVMEPFKLPKI
jgi:hypothetical protein